MSHKPSDVTRCNGIAVHRHHVGILPEGQSGFYLTIMENNECTMDANRIIFVIS